MPLLEILLGSLAPVVAKSLLKVWLKDSEIAADLSSEVVDLLKKKGLDVLTQRAGRRTFERIGDDVAQSLLPFFEASGLEAHSQEAVVRAVAETIETSKLTASLLAQRNLDPGALARLWRDERSDAVRHFGENEKAFYWRMLQETARRIIEISTQLPGFQVATLSEILRREDEIRQIVRETLSKVREIELASRAANPSSKYAEFETRYREAVVRTLDRVQLIGIDVEASTSKEQKLSSAYVNLEVTLDLQPIYERIIAKYPSLVDARTPNDVNLLHHLRSARNMLTHGLTVSEFPDDTTLLQSLIDRYERQDMSGFQMKKGRMTIEGALGYTQRMLVRGIAGSGKTTLLKWIAVSVAGRRTDNVLASWNDVVPFFLPLREYVDGDLPRLADFPRFGAPTLVDEIPEGWVRHCLEAGRAVILVDSVDEVPQTQRLRVRDWLRNLVDEFKKVRFFVTSRPSAIEEAWLDREGFDDAELLPMQLPDILSFIDHWYEAVLGEYPNTQKRDELLALREHLKHQIRATRSLQLLATNPLLCAAICALHRDRRGIVPSDRVELYEAFCQMLLNRRGQDQGVWVDTIHAPHLTYREKRALLSHLAYWMMRNNLLEAQYEDVLEQFNHMLPSMTRSMQVDSQAILNHLVERSGVVRQPRVGYVDFIHRTFQEFLAASAMIDHGDIYSLYQPDKVDNDQWREMMLLAAGLADEKKAELLVAKLLDLGDDDPQRRHRAYLLAVGCLETRVQLPSELQARISDRLQAIVPPRNSDEVVAISRAGELAVPFLRRMYDAADAEVEVLCIRALAMIGGEGALDALKSYYPEDRPDVIRALFHAADAFERQSYFRDVLAPLNISDLRLKSISSLEGFEYLKTLRLLMIEDMEQVSDLSPIRSISTLNSLRLWNLSRVSTLSPLSTLSSLIVLDLRDLTQVSDLSPLCALTKLTSLTLWSPVGIHNLSPLTSLLSLTLLDLRDLDQVSDLEPLSTLSNLTSLRLSRMAQVSDLRPLSTLSNLTSLRLSRIGQVSDLGPLSTLSNLTSLDLWNLGQLSDLSPLCSLSSLTLLDLRDLDQVSDLEPLTTLSNLTTLRISRMAQVSDLRSLSTLSIYIVDGVNQYANTKSRFVKNTRE